MTEQTNETSCIVLSNNKSGPRVKNFKNLTPEDIDDLAEEVEHCARYRGSTAKPIPDEDKKLMFFDAFSGMRSHTQHFKADRKNLYKLEWSVPNADPDVEPDCPFICEMYSYCCGSRWAKDQATQHENLRMRGGERNAFLEFYSKVKSMNDRLCYVGDFYNDSQLLALLSRGITPALEKCLEECGVEITATTTLKKWKESVLDIERRFAQELKAAVPKRTSDDSSSLHPNKFFASSAPSSSVNSCASSRVGSKVPAGKFSFKSFSAMSETEVQQQRDFIDKIKACHMCCTAYAGHQAKECGGGFLSVPFRPLTHQMVDFAKDFAKKNNFCPILYEALLKAFPESAPSVSAVTSSSSRSPISDLSAFMPPPPAPSVSAVYGRVSVAHIAQDSSLYHEPARVVHVSRSQSMGPLCRQDGHLRLSIASVARSDRPCS
ncbi:hypothetical protein GYMLUDRAFT_85486 [Collybiopsis luxurians FD-317 M1]|uniref:Uncharacterized protein n=1 Tax=Collybiopsis luxurians FD-317 M1 TaxID=944289 RepID=A0A0D0CVP8_9AGAR|nr:hypothetical protein GYMLUDRAFT_85486 [Collybiopsis luxurians FD-317 M1]